jgi:pimeloyl-ACP methyl ester carboxylesterase
MDAPVAAPVLPPALSGERIEFESPAGRLSVYVDGQGPPLLLVHSMNACGSAAEMRPLHAHCRSFRTVFSVDLPGFGFSERSDRVYSPRLMTDALHAFVALIQRRCGPGPVDALALSLGCEFLARAASEAPDVFGRLALVSPTGFSGRKRLRGPPGSTRGMAWLYRTLRGPGTGWAGRVFGWLTRPGVVRYFLERSWGSKAIDEPLWAYDLLSAAQPGAPFAPLYFLSADLFSADIHTVYEQLHMPVWVSHGQRGDFTNYRSLALVLGRPNWQVTVYPTGALPYFEIPAEFCAAFERFLR